MHTTMTAIESQDRFRTEEDCELALAGPGGGHFKTDGWGAHRVLRSLFGVRLLTFQIAKSVLEFVRHLSSRMPPGG